jgi:hypothetical protein
VDSSWTLTGRDSTAIALTGSGGGALGGTAPATGAVFSCGLGLLQRDMVSTPRRAPVVFMAARSFPEGMERNVLRWV